MRRALRRWGWRDWLVLAALVAVVIVSRWPWFGRSVASGDGTTMRFSVSAWTGSTQWTVAVLLAMGAGVVWLVARTRGRFERVAGWSALAIVLLSIGLAVRRWQTIPGPGGRLVEVGTVEPAGYTPPDPHTLFAIHRDRLNIEHLRGYWSGVRYGLYLGLIAMGVLALMLLAALATHRARADVGESG